MNTTTLRTTSAPAIGTYWPEQGGTYAGTIRGQNGQPDYHLIVASGQQENVEALAALDKPLEFGGYGKDIAGARSFADGAANTRALLDSGHEHPAAKAVSALTINGHSDYYLPAAGELRLLHTNVPELFKKDGWYWSSTQYSPGYAWAQVFEDGLSYIDRKYDEFRAVAVRRLAI